MNNDSLNEELFKQRKIFLFGEITEELSLRIIKELLFLAKNDEPISMFISSGGGDLDSTANIIDVMNLIKSQNTIKTIGLKACSAGAYVLALGSPGYRYVLTNSTIMLHVSSLELEMDKESNQEAFIDFNKKYGGKLYNIIAKACSKTSDKFIKDIANDMWLDAQSALKYKIVDKIIKDCSEL